MAEFSRLVITNKGQALLAKMMTGEGNVEFTKISTSDMEYTLEQLEALTEFSGVKQTVSVSKVTRTNGVAVTIEATFDNTELTQGYHMRALGLYAIDPDDGEILYAVTAEMSGCCYMPAYNGVTVSGACIKLVTTVGNAENVSLEVDPGVYATVGEIKELRESVDGIETWKDSTQKRLDNWGPTITGHGQIINSLRDSIGNLKPVATSGSYNDLSNKPSIPAAVRVKGNAESSYRTGDVNLTAENIGALPSNGGIMENGANIHFYGRDIDTGITMHGQGYSTYIYPAEISTPNLVVDGEYIQDVFAKNENILTTVEQIETNTASNNIAGALAVKDINNKLKRSTGTYVDKSPNGEKLAIASSKAITIFLEKRLTKHVKRGDVIAFIDVSQINYNFGNIYGNMSTMVPIIVNAQPDVSSGYEYKILPAKVIADSESISLKLEDDNFFSDEQYPAIITCCITLCATD